jgi:hypothetical protein
MVEEMDALGKNEASDLMEFPTGINLIGRKCVFEKNLNAEGKMEKYKSWLVANGYSQDEGIEIGDILSCVSKLNSIIFLLYVVVAFDFEVE